MKDESEPLERRSYESGEDNIVERIEGLKERLNQHARGIENRLHSFIIKAMIALGIMGVATTAALVGFGIVLERQSDVDTQIQSQRRLSVLETCSDQNDRHDKTVKKIIDISAAAIVKAPSPRRRKQILASRETTIGLIDALAPYRNCVNAVNKAVQPIPLINKQKEHKP